MKETKEVFLMVFVEIFKQKFNIFLTNRILAVNLEINFMNLVIQAVFHQKLGTVETGFPFTQIVVKTDEVRKPIL